MDGRCGFDFDKDLGGKGIQGYLDNCVIHLSRSKYFSVNKKISLDRSTLDCSTLYRTWFNLV